MTPPPPAKFSFAVVILAAGQGKRMQSDLPKVLHPLHGKPLLHYVIATACSLQPRQIVAVVGHRRNLVREALEGSGVELAVQEPQLGTGHAVLCARPFLEKLKSDAVLVLYGDVPLLKGSTLEKLLQTLEGDPEAGAALLLARLEEPQGYGRIQLDEHGDVTRIKEEKDCTPNEKKNTLINTGIGVFRSEPLWEALAQVKPLNAQGEYYLTDVPGILRSSGLRVRAVYCEDTLEIQGVNSPEDLKRLEVATPEKR